MSVGKRNPARLPARASTAPATKARSIGSRAFNRRARVSRRQAARKRVTRGRFASRPSLGPRETLSRIPRAALICAVVGCLNAICWSIVTPPFQVPDEPSHFAYAQVLAKDERLPTSGRYNYSVEEATVLGDLRNGPVIGHTERRPVSSLAEQRRLQRDLHRSWPHRVGTDAGVAASQPPLYYALEVVPYELGLSGTLLDRLELMRLLSAVMAGLTALFVFLFVRETLPGVRWAWTVGGLSVALAPLLGFMSGAVNPDSMFFAVSAAIFFCLARAFRCGLTRKLANAIGALTAIGFLTKLNFIGLAPGVILGLIVLTVRASRTHGRAAVRSLLIALAIAVSPACMYLLGNVLSNHAGFGFVSDAIASIGGVSVIKAISYVWQFYLPHLPGMTHPFPGILTTRELWFDRSVGLYGWLDTSFPLWVDDVALAAAGALGLLCVRTLVGGREILRGRLGEVVVYAAMGLGLTAMVGATSYVSVGVEGSGYFEPRYIFPLIPLLAVGLALAARGAGRRWGPVVGAAIVTLFLAHDIFSQLLVVARYYG
jgi:Predicted membrane protein (DUF2142)